MGNLRLYEGQENPWIPLNLGLITIETNTQSPKFLERILIFASLDFTFSPGFTNLVLRSLRLVLEVNTGTLCPEKGPEDPLKPFDLGLNP